MPVTAGSSALRTLTCDASPELQDSQAVQLPISEGVTRLFWVKVTSLESLLQESELSLEELISISAGVDAVETAYIGK